MNWSRKTLMAQRGMLWLMVGVAATVWSAIDCASMVSEGQDGGLRSFEFPQDQPGGVQDGSGVSYNGAGVFNDGGDDLLRQGLTNGTVINGFPGETRKSVFQTTRQI